MLYFFMSHAAGDDEDYARRFYADLCLEVGRLAHVDDRAGFLDVAGHGGGSSWQTATDDAVGRCRVFVALCSPRYFHSERCGREWSVFAQRLRRYSREAGIDAPALIPVLWADSEGDGEPADWYGHRAMIPDSPGQAGLHQLIRLRSWRHTYRSFVTTLAQRILDTATTYPIPSAATDMDLAAVPNAFAAPDSESLAPPTAGERADMASAQRVHFVVAAGTQDEMEQIRNDVQFYGAAAPDWRPYLPTLAEPLAARAQSVAAERLFGSNVEDLAGLRGCIERAHRNNDIVILLVDAWATKLEPHRTALVEADSTDEAAVAVLVPASRDDQETVRHGGELRSDVRSTFRHSATRRGALFRIDIDTAGGFDDELMAVLEEAQNRIFNRGHVFRQPTVSTTADRPILEGP
jgi:FxsC-like protein